MSAYISIRNWVDSRLKSDFSGQVRAVLLPGMIPFGVPLIAEDYLTHSALQWLIAICSIWFVLWNAFIFWRIWRYMKGAAINSDRHYDRKGKYDLPPDYTGTESRTKAKRAKRRKSQR